MAKKQRDLVTLFIGYNHKIHFHGYATKKAIARLEKIGQRKSVARGIARLVWHDEDREGIPRPSYEYIWANGEFFAGHRPPVGW